MERLELKTDSGFPDVHFLERHGGTSGWEGTLELKFSRTRVPVLKDLMKGTQKANFLDYYEAGGRRRFLLCCTNSGGLHFYYPERVVKILLGKETRANEISTLDEEPLDQWFLRCLGVALQ